PAQGAGPRLRRDRDGPRVQRRGGAGPSERSVEESESGGGLKMTLDVLIDEARERLLARAKKEGLATVGYDVLASPLGPLWVAIGPNGVTTIHYGDAPSESELRRLVRVYGPGVVPDHRRSSSLARELDQYFSGKRKTFDVDVD